MHTLWQDIRYGLRILAKNPGFTAVAVLTLALGIGANTAIFSVVYGVLLRPLPYPEPDRIAQICATYKGELQYSGFTAREFDFWRSHSEPFDFLAARTGLGVNLTGGTESVRVRAHRVSSAYFNVLGVQPFIGRNFSDDEDSPGGPNVAILSYGLWKSQFGGNAQLIGKSISMDGAAYTAIGVMPSGFQSIPPADLWTTIAQVNRTTGSGNNYTVIGRLKNGTSHEQASSYLSVLKDSFLKEFRPRTPIGYRTLLSFNATAFSYMVSRSYRTPLLVLLGAIAFVLLIACVNIANLLIARSAARNREFAVRTALGANRRRLFWQLLRESLLLALLGGALGVLLGYWSMSFLLALAPTDLPRAHEISLDRWALAFTATAAMVSGILFGTMPALQASKTDLNESLKEGGARAGSGLRHQRMRSALVVVEVALSLVLLAGAALLVETFGNLLRTNPGFDPHAALSAQIWPTGERFSSTEAMVHFNRRVLERIRTIPGVQSAAMVTGGLPLENGGNAYVQFVGRKLQEGISADYRQITPEYFQTLGVPLRQGRFFTDLDSADSHGVAIINEAMARTHYADRNPIGEHLKLEKSDSEIVGVVGNVRSALNQPAPPTVFVPDAQSAIGVSRAYIAWFPTCILVRTTLNPRSLSNRIADAVHSADASVPIGKIQSMDEVLSTSIAFQRFLMILMGIFAGLALTLATVGIYGVMAYLVDQGTPEIGVRIALGALRSDVLKIVLRRGMLLTLGGIVAGLSGAVALTRFLAKQLYEVQPTDPRVLEAVAMALGLIALLACWIPARRATRVDPIVALRYE